MSSYSSPKSAAKTADRVDAARDIAPVICGICLADVPQGLGVTENGECFLQLCEVLQTDDHGSIVAVARYHDALVLALDTIDHLGEMVSDGSQRFGGHGHNCGQRGPWLSSHKVARVRGRGLVIAVLTCAHVFAGLAAWASPASARDAVVTSFDGTPIAVHFYGPTTAPASGVAPTVLVGSPYPSPGETRPDLDVGDRIGLATLRGAGYNVLTWDPRGIGASAGSIMFDSPAVEGGDVRAIIDFVAAQPEAQLDAPGDPRVGMSGTSYGATIQYIAAALDARVDAIVPDIGWESLTTALRRGGAVKTGWLAALCGLDGVPGAVDGKASAADVKPASASDALKATCLEGVRGRLSAGSRKWLADHGPGALIDRVRAPALIMQGTTDTLFPLDQASAAFAALRKHGVPVAMLWYCGGHVACASEPGDPRTLARAGLAWFDRWLRPDRRSTPARRSNGSPTTASGAPGPTSRWRRSARWTPSARAR